VNPLHRAAAVLGLFLALEASLAAAEPRFSTPVHGDVLASGVSHEVRWTSPCEDAVETDEMELVLSVDGGWTFPIRLTAELSPCSSSFRWKVPALSASRAVLAVRRGIEGEPESERVAIVSGEFRITSFETSPTSSLVRGPSEWWTQQALLEIGAESLLGGALREEPERVHAPVTESDLEEPPPAPAEIGVEREEILSRSRDGIILAVPEPYRLRRAAPLPLRE
jgi:hypothetical protein